MHKIELTNTPPTHEVNSAPPIMTTTQTPANQTPANQTGVDEINLANNNDNSMKSPLPKLTLILSVVAVMAGLATGFGGYKLKNKTGGTSLFPSPSSLQRVAEKDKIKAGDIFGVADEKTFKDTAEGYLEEGGVDGEGSHKLVRVGGISQTVYLTSSITDLDQFIGMEVKIWGETFKGQKAGWLMDVGRIEIVNPTGQAPAEE